MSLQPVVLVASPTYAFVAADDKGGSSADPGESGGMEVSVDVRKSEAWCAIYVVQPRAEKSPRRTAIRALCTAQVAAEIDRIACNIARVHQDHLVVEGLAV